MVHGSQSEPAGRAPLGVAATATAWPQDVLVYHCVHETRRACWLASGATSLRDPFDQMRRGYPMRIKAIKLTPLQEGLFFFITGTILLIAALFACVQWSADFSSGATVTAEIEQIRRERGTTIDDEYHYVAYVRYTYEGVTYDHIPLYNFSSSMREGDSVELLINPTNPRRVNTSWWGMPFIFALAIIMCSFFIVRGLLFIVHARPQRK